MQPENRSSLISAIYVSVKPKIDISYQIISLLFSISPFEFLCKFNYFSGHYYSELLRLSGLWIATNLTFPVVICLKLLGNIKGNKPEF